MTVGQAFMFIDYATEKPSDPETPAKPSEMSAEELKEYRAELRRLYGDVDGDTG